MNNFKSLTDSIAISNLVNANGNDVEIFYLDKANYSDLTRDLTFSLSFALKNGHDLGDVKQLIENNYISLGQFKTNADCEDIYDVMQGENWSPLGEARDLIEKKRLCHTSMSVGDVVRVNDQYMFVDMCGFKNLNEVLNK